MGESPAQPPADISVWIQTLEANPPAGGRASSPDLVQQLKQTLRRPVNRAVCLETDIDPSCDLLSRFATEHAVDVHQGLKVLREMLNLRVVRITERSPRKLERSYPHLSPSLLVRQLFRRSMRPGQSPTDVGVLMLDAITAAHVGALAAGRTPAALPVIVDDLPAGRRLRLIAGVAETLADLLARADITAADRAITHGSPVALRSIAAATRVGDSELWLTVDLVAGCRTMAMPLGCTRSGACVTICPVHLQPAALLEARQRGDVAMGERFSARACIECGLCSAACPSFLPLLPSIRELKRISA